MQLEQLEERSKAAEHRSAEALASLNLEHSLALREAERRFERERAQCEAEHSTSLAKLAEQLQARAAVPGAVHCRPPALSQRVSSPRLSGQL